jgi:alpha-tubulin suppressor-like RCC1 family protein
MECFARRVAKRLLWTAGMAIASLPMAASAQTLPALADVIQTTAGQFHSCALTRSGAVSCWGSNRVGQLGARDAAPNQRETPVAVFGLDSGVQAIAAGQLHTCALLQSGQVRCWGANAAGQLGDGNIEPRAQPVTVSALGGSAIAISAGEEHSCAVLVGGALRCWGRNTYGQLGDGSFEDRLLPVSVQGIAAGATAVAAGHYHSCAVQNGAALCWGRNELGQLGDGQFGGRATPAPVSGLGSGVGWISAARGHACALTLSGAVRCWGDNAEGQLGDGSRQQRRTPVTVSGLGSGVRQVVTNFQHSCALNDASGVLCWGDNFYGQIGDDSAFDRELPTPVSGLGNGIASISAGYLHGCASTMGTEEVRCWGNNFDGQLGDGSFTNRLTPRDVVGLSTGVEQVATGFQHSCAWSAARGIQCWGDNSFGQLGNGATTSSETPVAVQQFGNASGVMSGGVFHTCALSTAGGVRCWGQNSFGQLGDDSFTDRALPTDVAGLASGVNGIAAGGFHTCAVLGSGSVRCWGSNFAGQLGIGSQSDLGAPAEVTGFPAPVQRIAAGEAHSCALTQSGAVLCWGSNAAGQLGDGTLTGRTSPTSVSGLSSGVREISVSGNFSCALLQSGAVRCWGGNESGQLGDGSVLNRLTPAPVSGLTSGIVSIEAAWYHACALDGGGGLRCWGRNTEGQLGDNSTLPRLRPQPVAGLGVGVLANSGGGGQNCVLLQGGRLRCWGANNFGQVGDGSSWGVRTPVAVVLDAPRRAVSSVTPAANAASSLASIDASGRYVAFQSEASNLIAGDSNAAADVFRRDRETGEILRISVDNDGIQLAADSSEPAISGDGQLVAFVAADAAVGALLGESHHKRLERQKGGGHSLLLRNLLTGSTQRVGPAQPGGTDTAADIAAEGGSIAWTQPVSNATEGLVGQQNVYRSTLVRNVDGSVMVGAAQCVTCRPLTAAGLPSSTPSNGDSRNPSLSDDGRWLAWETKASNTLPGGGGKSSPCPGSSVILLRNVLTGVTLPVSTPAAGGGCGAPIQGSSAPSVSGDGTAVAFASDQPLVAGDSNAHADVHLWTAASGELIRVSVGSGGEEGNGASGAPSLSADGRSVAFVSAASNLDTSFADNNDVADVHVARIGGSVARLSVSDAGGEAARPGIQPALSDDGSQLAYASTAGNLAPGAVDNLSGVFVRSNPLAASSSSDRSGVWWRASESGWGLVTADQGSAVVLGWFTYDVDGEPTWYSGALTPQSDGSYRGQLFRNTGVPLAQISGLAVESSFWVADASLRFSGRDGLQFDYQLVGSAAGSKTMVRFPFGARRLQCRPSDAAGRLAASNYSDIWWGGAQTSGWGLFITQIDAQLFPVWFTFDGDREAIFYTGIGSAHPDNSFSGTLFRSRNGTPAALIDNAPASTGTDSVGSFRLAPSDGSHADFSYSIAGVTQSKRIERYVFGSTLPVCETIGSTAGKDTQF